MKDLFIITGTSGSGKTSMIEPLNTLLPISWEVWDIDEIVWNLPSYGHPDAPILTSWNPGDDTRVFDECKNICIEDAGRQAEKNIVLCGTMLPHEVFESSKKLFKKIHWSGLYASPEVIRTRLRKRGWDEEKVEFYANTFDWFRKIPEQIEDGMTLIDTSQKKPENVAKEINDWIRKIVSGEHGWNSPI